MLKRHWGAILLCLVVLGLLVWFISLNLEWTTTTSRTGYTKEARENPYLAAELLLGQLGFTVRHDKGSPDLARLPRKTTLVLPSHQSYLDDDAREQLLGWVEQGGHLVILLEQGQEQDKLLTALNVNIAGQLDWHEQPYNLYVENASRHVKLSGAPVFTLQCSWEWAASLDGKVSTTGEDTAKRIFRPIATTPSVRPPESRELDLDGNHADPDDDEATEAITAALYARFRHGEGYVTVGSNMPLRNNSLGKADHAALLVHLMTLADEDRPVIFQEIPSHIGLLRWLRDNAAETWLGLALLIVAGLWRVIPRLGPILPEPPPQRPGLREHLAASGYFLLHERAYVALLKPMREDALHLIEQLQHRYPEIKGTAPLAAHLLGTTEDAILRALQTAPYTHHEFLRSCHTLAALRTRCHSLLHPSHVSGVSP